MATTNNDNADQENPLLKATPGTTRKTGKLTKDVSLSESASAQFQDLAIIFQSIPIVWLLCGFFCAMVVPGSIGGYAIYVGSKFTTDGNQQCRADAVWLLGMGGLYIGTPLLGCLTVLSIRSEFFSLGKIMSFVMMLGCCFGFGWMIYCVYLFFNEPICKQMEAHLFGKILAWFFAIQLSMLGIVLACGICGMIVLCLNSIGSN